MDDRVVSPSVAEFIRRVVPGATVHKLLDEGHFSYFCFCDECHRQIFSTLFGIPQGPINPAPLPSDVASELAEETTAPDNLTEEEQGKSSLAWSRSVLRISSIDTRPYYYYYYLTQYLTDRRAFLRCHGTRPTSGGLSLSSCSSIEGKSIIGWEVAAPDYVFHFDVQMLIPNACGTCLVRT